MWNRNPSDGIVAVSPLVLPQFTSRPWGRRANIDAAHSAGPTWSRTRSHARSAGDLVGPARDVAGAVVEHVVRTELGGPLQLCFTPGGGEHRGAHVLGQLDGGDAHAAARGVDQDRFSGRQAAHREQGVPGGEPGGGEGGRRLVRHGVGQPVHVGLGGQAQLGVATVDGAADHPELAVQVAPTGELRAVGHLGEGGVDDDSIAERDARDVGSDRDDLPGHIHSGDVREREAGQVVPAVALHHVEVVERGVGDAHHDVPPARFGIRHRLVAKDLGSARFGVAQCSHVSPRMNGWARAPGWVVR